MSHAPGPLRSSNPSSRSHSASASLAAAKGLSVNPETAVQWAIDCAVKHLANGRPLQLLTPDIQLGLWSMEAGFTPLSSPGNRATAVRISACLDESRGTGVNLHFARLFGYDQISLSASTVATFGARDIVLVLDYSGSMSYDTQLRHIRLMGEEEIETGLTDIWNSLKAVDDRLNAVAGTGMNNPARHIIAASDYFDYVRENVSYDYRNYYGYLTWMDYLQYCQREYHIYGVPLYETPQQPVTAVKDAVDIFVEYFEQVPTDDRVALVSYTYIDEAGGYLEQSLTGDFNLIEARSRCLHAGYYNGNTHIAGGLEEA